MKKILFSAVIATTILTGCGSNDSLAIAEGDQFPDWYMNPIMDGGLSDAKCVKFTGNMSIDQKKAVANARVGLAQQIETKIIAMDKTYAKSAEANGQTNVTDNFESISKQVTSEALNGVRPTNYGTAKINGITHVCARVELAPDSTKEFFEKLIESSGRDIKRATKDELYQDFMLDAAEKSLNEQFGK